MNQFIKHTGIVAFMAMIAFVAGNAMAAPTISGGADASFGTYSYDNGKSENSQVKGGGFGATIQANVILTGGEGPISYYVRMRMRNEVGSGLSSGFTKGTKGGLQTNRVRLRFKPVDVFAISVGKMPGIGGTGVAGTQPGRSMVGLGNDKVGFYDNPGITFEFNNGMIKAGLALGTRCQMDCEKIYTNTSQSAITPNDGSADKKELKLNNQQTMMPYFQLNLKDLGLMVGLRIANDSAKRDKYSGRDNQTKAQDLEVKASTTALDVAYNIAPIGGKVALEYAMENLPISEAKGTAATGNAATPGHADYKSGFVNTFYKKNQPKRTTMVVGFSAMGAGFSIANSSIDYGKGNDGKTAYTKPKKSVMALSYMMPMGGGKIGASYAASTSENAVLDKDHQGNAPATKAKVIKAKANEIRFVMSSGF